MPEFVPPSQQLFNLFPSNKNTRNAMQVVRQLLEGDSKFLWLDAHSFSEIDSKMAFWYKSMFELIFTEQSKILSDSFIDI